MNTNQSNEGADKPTQSQVISDLVAALGYYMEICGRTGQIVDNECIPDAHKVATAAMDKVGML